MRRCESLPATALVAVVIALCACRVATAQLLCESQQIEPPIGEAGSGLSMRAHGDLLVTGAPYQGIGIVQVYRRVAGTWLHEQQLEPWDDPGSFARFGMSVAIAGDMILVGTPQADDLGSSSGAVYVFARSGPAWLPYEKLLASNGAAGDRFGSSIAVSGTRAIIHASGRAVHYLSGTMYEFSFFDKGWNEQSMFFPSCPSCVEATINLLAFDGDRAAVSAWLCTEGDAYGHCLSSYRAVFVFDRDGPIWTQVAELPALDPSSNSFGNSGVLVGDLLVVGDSSMQVGQTWSAGGVHCYRQTRPGWVLEQTLTVPDGGTYHGFGRSVAIDGQRLFIGAIGDDDVTINGGAVYVYEHDGTEWSFRQKLLPGSDDVDALGVTMTLADGAAIVGAEVSNNRVMYVFDGSSLDCNANGVCDNLEDCNGNGTADDCDIEEGSSGDCDGNGVPDECVTWTEDCNANLVPDSCDVAGGASQDCDGNGVPDECQLDDCNGNGVPDSCDLAAGTSADCNANGIPDECSGVEADCNENGVPDECDIADGTSQSCTGGPIPDECLVLQRDCNDNGVPDPCDIDDGVSLDIDANGRPDECECLGDLDDSGVVTSTDLQAMVSSWGPVAAGHPADLDRNGIVGTVDLLALLRDWGICPE